MLRAKRTVRKIATVSSVISVRMGPSPVTIEMLKQWNDPLKFVCYPCAFVNGVYDAEVALLR